MNKEPVARSLAEACEQQYATAENLESRMKAFQTSGGETLWERLWSFYRFSENESVLEIGCGNGEFWVQNEPKVLPPMTITLSDLSEGMLASAKSRLSKPNFDFQIQDAQALQCPPGSYSYALSHFMLYHLKDPALSLRHIAAALKPAGKLGVVLPIIRPEHVPIFVRWAFELAPEIEKPYWETSTISFGAEEFQAVAEGLFALDGRIDETNEIVFESGEQVCDFLWSLPVFQSDLIRPELRPALIARVEEEIARRGPIVEKHSIALMKLSKCCE